MRVTYFIEIADHFSSLLNVVILMFLLTSTATQSHNKAL